MPKRLNPVRVLCVCAAVVLGAAGALRSEAGIARSPRVPAAYDLGRDESLGGHTLARHVGRSDRELAARLRKERRIAAASTYTDRATAERVVGEAIDRSRARVAAWLGREGPRPNLVLDYHGDPDRPVGRVLRRGASLGMPTSDAVVVLRWSGPGAFFVLTSYPEVPR